jgi:hypothetical protein
MERQWRVNDVCSCITDYLMGREQTYSTINQSGAFIGKNASDDIVSASYNGVPTLCQQCLWRLRTLNSNKLSFAVSKLSLTWSVFTICPCIQLHTYACNVLLI